MQFDTINSITCLRLLGGEPFVPEKTQVLAAFEQHVAAQAQAAAEKAAAEKAAAEKAAPSQSAAAGSSSAPVGLASYAY